MDLQEAVDWCVEHFAEVKFISVHGVKRVELRVPGGWPHVERYTFLEAVQDAKELDEQHLPSCEESGK